MTEHEDLAKRVSALEKELLEAKKQLEAMKPPEPFVPKREWQRPDYTEGMSMSGPALKPMVDLINPQGLKSHIGARARNRIGEPGGFGPGPAKQWPKQSRSASDKDELKIPEPPKSRWSK